MNVRIDLSFERDVKRLKIRNCLEKLLKYIEYVQLCNKSDEVKNLKKLKGTRHYYRIRLGNYRIGISIKENTVDFIRILPRKDIYKYFP